MRDGPGAPYDRIAQEFAEARDVFRPNERRYIDTLVDGLVTPASILDLGCGNGHPVATHLVSLGHRVTGVDESPAMLARAATRLPNERWIQGDMRTIVLDEVFDAAVCWDAIFHLERRYYPLVVERLFNWLRSGGRLLVSSGGTVREPAGFTDTMFGHEFFYDSLPPVDMEAAVRAAGFDLVVSEMCDPPGEGRQRGKWAILAQRVR